MKVSRQLLEKIVYEEFIKFVRGNLSEAPKSTDPLDPEFSDDEEIPDPDSAPEEPTGMPELGTEDPPQVPDEPDPADDQLAKDDAGEEPPIGGSIASDVQGKTIQSITMDNDSKMIPGATEVVLTFNEIPDALRIMVTKTGRVKFFFRGLHNDVGGPGEDSTDEYTQAPDDIDDVPEGDNITVPNTPNPSDDDDDTEEIEIP